MAFKIIALDIETVPVDINKLSPDVIRYLLEKDENKRTDNTRFFKKQKEPDLNTLEYGGNAIDKWYLNKIICCCMYDGEKYYKFSFSEHAIFTDNILKEEVKFNTEKFMLDRINNEINNYGQFITFNGNTFDMPMLRMRSIENKVTTNISNDIQPWDKFKYIDVRYELIGADKFSVGDLGFMCNKLGIKPPGWQFDKSLMKNYWDDGRIDEIIKGCCEDVRATWELHEYLELYNKIK